jgi:5-methylcytosine-specific restriction endonuclease McrA
MATLVLVRHGETDWNRTHRWRGFMDPRLRVDFGESEAEGPARFGRGVKQVLVLNASYEPLNVTTVRRAHVLVFKGKAEVIEKLDRPLASATSTFPWPHVIRLVHYVRVPRTVQRKISRRALFARDGWRCVYCGTAGGRLTLDHVVPRSRGGQSVWENVVTSCAPCNLRKGDRLPDEVRMQLRQPPKPPTPALFIKLASPTIPTGWRPYLGHAVQLAGGAAAA